MTISIDWSNKLVLSTASITDVVAFKDTLRDFEDDEIGMLNPAIISYKRLDLGGGAYFHGVDFINGWQLKFPNSGNYTVIGNIGATIVPVAGVFVDRVKSAAFATVAGAGGGSSPTADDVAIAVWSKIIEAGLSATELLRLIAASTQGDATGLESGSPVFKSIDGTKNRISATYTAGTRVVSGRDVT